MKKKVLMVSCTLQLDHNDRRLILVPDEDGEKTLAEIRSARGTVEIPVEYDIADVVNPDLDHEEAAINDETKAALISPAAPTAPSA